MKKVCLVAGLLSFSAFGFAQQKASRNAQPKDRIVTIEKTPPEKMVRLEEEISGERTSQIKMQKHFGGIRSILPATNEKKKLVVNRIGSKQLNWSKD